MSFPTGPANVNMNRAVSPPASARAESLATTVHGTGVPSQRGGAYELMVNARDKQTPQPAARSACAVRMKPWSSSLFIGVSRVEVFIGVTGYLSEKKEMLREKVGSRSAFHAGAERNLAQIGGKLGRIELIADRESGGRYQAISGPGEMT